MNCMKKSFKKKSALRMQNGGIVEGITPDGVRTFSDRPMAGTTPVAPARPNQPLSAGASRIAGAAPAGQKFMPQQGYSQINSKFYQDARGNVMQGQAPGEFVQTRPQAVTRAPAPAPAPPQAARLSTVSTPPATPARAPGRNMITGNTASLFQQPRGGSIGSTPTAPRPRTPLRSYPPMADANYMAATGGPSGTAPPRVGLTDPQFMAQTGGYSSEFDVKGYFNGGPIRAQTKKNELRAAVEAEYDLPDGFVDKAKDMSVSGGPIKGPGGPTDDIIPILASKNEYMIPADTVRAIGKKNLDAIVAATHKYAKPTGNKFQNRSTLRKMQDGGYMGDLEEAERMRRNVNSTWQTPPGRGTVAPRSPVTQAAIPYGGPPTQQQRMNAIRANTPNAAAYVESVKNASTTPQAQAYRAEVAARAAAPAPAAPAPAAPATPPGTVNASPSQAAAANQTRAAADNQRRVAELNAKIEKEAKGAKPAKGSSKNPKGKPGMLGRAGRWLGTAAAAAGTAYSAYQSSDKESSDYYKRYGLRQPGEVDPRSRNVAAKPDADNNAERFLMDLGTRAVGVPHDAATAIVDGTTGLINAGYGMLTGDDKLIRPLRDFNADTPPADDSVYMTDSLIAPSKLRSAAPGVRNPAQRLEELRAQRSQKAAGDDAIFGSKFEGSDTPATGEVQTGAPPVVGTETKASPLSIAFTGDGKSGRANAAAPGQVALSERTQQPLPGAPLVGENGEVVYDQAWADKNGALLKEYESRNVIPSAAFTNPGLGTMGYGTPEMGAGLRNRGGGGGSRDFGVVMPSAIDMRARRTAAEYDKVIDSFNKSYSGKSQAKKAREIGRLLEAKNQAINQIYGEETARMGQGVQMRGQDMTLQSQREYHDVMRDQIAATLQGQMLSALGRSGKTGKTAEDIAQKYTDDITKGLDSIFGDDIEGRTLAQQGIDFWSKDADGNPLDPIRAVGEAKRFAELVRAIGGVDVLRSIIPNPSDNSPGGAGAEDRGWTEEFSSRFATDGLRGALGQTARNMIPLVESRGVWYKGPDGERMIPMQNLSEEMRSDLYRYQQMMLARQANGGSQ